MAAGLRSSAASRLLRVSTESSRAMPCLASSSERSSSSSSRAWAPRRRESATSAWRSARPRRVSARPPATRARTSTPARPASSPRSRRLVCASRSARRRASATSRSAAARPAWRNSRSSSFRSVSWVRRPVQRAGQPRPPVQLPRVTPGLVPLAGGADQMAVQGPPLDVLLQPAAQPRPLAQQRLVGHLHTVLAHAEQPLVDQGVQHRPAPLVMGWGDLVERHAAAHHRLALARPGQAQQDPAGHRLLARRQPKPGAFGQPGHRPPHPTGLLVGGQGQRAAVAVLPALQQRTRQQRQPPGLLGDLADHRLGQARFQLQSGPTGGQLDRAAQLAGVHRADQHVVGGQQAGQGGVGGAVAVVVGPHGDHDGHRIVRLGSLGQGGQEPGPLDPRPGRW